MCPEINQFNRSYCAAKTAKILLCFVTKLPPGNCSTASGKTTLVKCNFECRNNLWLQLKFCQQTSKDDRHFPKVDSKTHTLENYIFSFQQIDSSIKKHLPWSQGCLLMRVFTIVSCTQHTYLHTCTQNKQQIHVNTFLGYGVPKTAITVHSDILLMAVFKVSSILKS